MSIELGTHQSGTPSLEELTATELLDLYIDKTPDIDTLINILKVALEQHTAALELFQATGDVAYSNSSSEFLIIATSVVEDMEFIVRNALKANQQAWKQQVPGS